MTNTFVNVNGTVIPADDARLSGLDPAFQSAWRLDGNVIAFDLAEVKRIKHAQMAAKRWEVETGGVEVNGMEVATDRDSQGLVLGAAFAASLDPNYEVRWKTDGGFVLLDAPTIIALAQAIRAHVQAAFDREAELTALIEAAETVAEVRAINIETGWSA